MPEACLRHDGPPHGTAIWLLLCIVDSSDVFGCHKVPDIKVASPHLGPTMCGFAHGSNVRAPDLDTHRVQGPACGGTA